MSARHGMLIGMVSSLFTLLIVFAFLHVANTGLAQNSTPPKPAENGQNLVTPTPEIPKDHDENAGSSVFPFATEAAAPDAATRYFHIPGSAFVPMHSNSGVEYAPWGCMYMTGPEDSSNYAVELPYGSVVTSLRMYFVDWSATYNGTMQFAQYNDGQGGTYLNTLQTAGSGGWSTITHSGLNLPLDYDNYSYVLYWNSVAAAGSDLQLCGFRIGYTVTSTIFLPTVMRQANP